jgi:GNAT superfamily N-acetyltransferase
VRDGFGVARCGLWWRAVARHDGQPTGAVGHFATADADAGAALLQAACARLQAEGCRRVLGPLDGSTWHAYRLVTDRGTAPPFVLEPFTPPHWNAAFARAGFSPVAHYVSARTALVAPAVPPVPGLTLRPLDGACLSDELQRLHPLVLDAFADSPFFTPLDAEEFVALYSRLAPLLRPGWVLVAEARDGPAGVVLALPDASGAVVVKTLAVAPAWERRGLASWLTATVQAQAAREGATHAIHALMHADNRSRRVSTRLGGAAMRRYALLGRRL